MKKSIAMCVGISLMAVSLGVCAAVMEPDVLIKNITQEVLSTIKQDKGIQANSPKEISGMMDAKVLPNFDFERMTRLATGKSWRNANPEQQKTLVAEFRNLLVHSYINVFMRYQDHIVEIKPFKMSAGANEVTIKTFIIKSGAQPLAVDYEMEKTADGWKVFDLVVDGVSLVTTYRSTFSRQVQQSGVDGLIKTLVAKNAANNSLVE